MPSALKDDVGETLIESLISLVIVSIAVTVVVMGAYDAAVASTSHRAVTGSDAAVKAAAESVKNLPYHPTAAPTDYGVRAPSGFTATVTKVCYLSTGSTSLDLQSSGTCAASDSSGLQAVTIKVTAPGGGASESVTVVKRQP